MARIKGKYDSKLLGSEEIAEATRAFHFEKPEGFTFTPGESIDLFCRRIFQARATIASVSFSLASAPHEDRLTIATRMRKSAYKEPLAAAQPGAGVRIVGPTGTMSLHDDPDRAIVMIAGGIGMAPSSACCAARRKPTGRAPWRCSIPTTDPRTRPTSTSCASWNSASTAFDLS